MPAAPEGAGAAESTTPPLTLVVPAFNESGRLHAGFERLRAAAASSALDLGAAEVLVVDDGSTDATAQRAAAELADGLHGRVLTLPKHLGKGAAVRAGMLEARGARVVFADADMSIDPVHLPELVAALDHCDVAVGSRAVQGRVDYGSWPRTVAGRCFNRAVRLAGGIELEDTQCGFKGFNRGPAILLAQLVTSNGYAFDVELLWLAGRLGLRVEAVPVTWVDVPGSTVRPLHDATRMLLDVLGTRRRHRVVVLAELDAGASVAAPPGTVRVALEDGPALVAEVAQLAAVRRCVEGAGSVRCVTFDELLAFGPGIPRAA